MFNLKGTLNLFNKKYYLIKKIIKIIEKKFILFGYQPLNTSSILSKKIFKKLNKKYNLNKKILYYINNNISFKNKWFLIFDLTIPLLNFIYNNINKLNFPFKRYQIQKVWRGEKPQKNRYREFYQCDIDIITLKKNNNLFLELEIITLCNNIFNSLNLKCVFLINHKFILYGICKILKIKKKLIIKFLNILDKKYKIGINNIIKQINKYKIIKKKKYKKLFIKIYKYKIKNIKDLLNFKNKFFKKQNIYGNKGIIYIENLLKKLKTLKLKNLKFKIDFTFSRGLNYYNKIIFEVYYKNQKTSIIGGGQYDNILNFKKKEKIYFIGLSFGINRIYNILKNRMYIKNNKKILIINFKKSFLIYKKLNLISLELIKNNFITSIFPYYVKIKKQIKYSLKNNINYILFLGKKEILNNNIKIKNLNTKKEYYFNNIKEVILFFKKKD